MKKNILSFVLLLSGSTSFACVFCNKEMSNEIYNSAFYSNLLIMLLAFIVLTIIIVILGFISSKRHKKHLSDNPDTQLVSPVPLTTTAMILGIGMGGFIDGIVLHQILQWHEMLSNKIPATNYVGKSVNMFWDGIFHAFCLLVVLIGIIQLWKLLKRNDINTSGKLLTGGLLCGWAMFNIVEGIIDHHILKLHNVVEFSANHNTGNYLFLGLSVILFVIGYALIKQSNKQYKN